MIEGIEPPYRTIAESITQLIHQPWSSASIDAIFYPNHIFYSGEYISADGGKPKSFAIDMRSEEAFEQIRELFRRAGKPLRCRARFELHSDGKFKMDWGYDDCDERGFAKFDEEEIKRMDERRKRLA